MTNKMDNNHPPEVRADKPLTEMTEAEFAQFLKDNPRQERAFKQSGMSRRSFIQLMGATLALSGAGLAGCAPTGRPSEEQILPYARLPEEMIPGIPLFFASSMNLGGYMTGLLIETHQGRPTRIEGNPQHPASLGATDVFTQGAILDLYNPDRSLQTRNNGEESTFEAFLEAVQGLELGDGTGMRLLTETVSSPTLASQIESLLETYPNARWYQYEPMTRDNALAGARLAFDQDVETVYQFENAEVVLSLESNFMDAEPGKVRYARDFATKRKVRVENPTMNRLYVAESTPTITGSAADHRLALRSSEIEALARALAVEFGVDVATSGDAPWSQEWFDAVVADLRANEGASLVVAGTSQPPIVHALAHAINAALNNVGNTVIYTDPIAANPVINMEEITALVEEMNNGDVTSLFIIGGNPLYTAPSDLMFGEALVEVPFSMHLSLYFNETSARSTWHVPQAHFVEEWSDGRAFNGALSLVQPPIGPLFETVRSTHELLALLQGDERTNYDIVLEFWQSIYEGDDFDAYWRGALHDGVAEDSAFAPLNVSLRGDFGSQIAEITPTPIIGLEVIFRPDSTIWDGRFVNNSWLQELPDPLTKVSWDTGAILSPATAEELGVSDEDLIDIQVNENTMQAAVIILRGHPDNAVTVTFGYGQVFLEDEQVGRNFNAYSIRSSLAPWFSGDASISATGNTYELARTRYLDMEESGIPAVRSGSLQQFIANPDFVDDMTDPKPEANLYDGAQWDYSDNHAWGMSIDLTSCIGCNACIIGCQMENNIPVVGKDAVANSREMSWLRVDRYTVEEAGEERTKYQPVPCMQCEQAPCELVCPVEATIHDHEGLNNMVYNRCIGTRYCAANCPYGVRRFNFLPYVNDESIMQEWRNPNVSVRPEGVMEKCTYCTQRINATRAQAIREGREIEANEITPACAAACPTQAITFGDINNEQSFVTQLKAQPHDYQLLGELNTKPRTTYLAKLYNPNESLHDGTSSEGEEE